MEQLKLELGLGLSEAQEKAESCSISRPSRLHVLLKVCVDSFNHAMVSHSVLPCSRGFSFGTPVDADAVLAAGPASPLPT